MSDIFYNNYIDIEENENSGNWWRENHDVQNGTYYHGNVINIAFDEWIESGIVDKI